MTHDVHPRTVWTSDLGRDAGHAPVVLDAAHSSKLLIPGGDFLLKADYHRQGGDLVLTGQDGHQVIVRNFFTADPQPDLVNEQGAMIGADLADHLAGSLTPGQYAAADGAGPQLKTIGVVDKISGGVRVKHVDGTSEQLQQGSPIYQGDVVETDDKSAIGIIFADRSVFSLGGHGRMVMDELVYDPDAHTGTSTMSVVQGTFSFVSGQIAKSAPDAMSIKTPVMTIGVRGTTVAGTAAAEGSENNVTLLNDADGGTGAIVIITPVGQVIMNSASQFLQLTSPYQPPPPPVILSAAQIQQLYSNAIDLRPVPPSQDPQLPAPGTQPPAPPAPTVPGTQQGTDQGNSGSGGHVDLGGKDQFTPVTLSGKPATSGTPLVTTTGTGTGTDTGSGASSGSTGGAIGFTGNGGGSGAKTDPGVIAQLQQAANANENSGGYVGKIYYAADYGGTLIGNHDGDTLVGASNLSNLIIAAGFADTIIGGMGDGDYQDFYYAKDLEHPLESASAVLSYASAPVPVTMSMDGHSGTIINGNGLHLATFYGIHSLVGSTGHGGILDYSYDASALSGITVDLDGKSVSSTVSAGQLTATITDRFQNFDHITGTGMVDIFYVGTTGGYTLNGGGNNNILSFANQSSGATVVMGTGNGDMATVAGGTDYFANFTSIVGSGGNDLFSAGDQGGFTIDGGNGKDTLSLSALSSNDGGAIVHARQGLFVILDGPQDNNIDWFNGIEVVVGSTYNDTFYGGSGISFVGGGGADQLSYAELVDQLTPVTVNLSAKTVIAGGVTDHFQDVASIIGGQTDDLFLGSTNGGFTIDGGDGTNTLSYANIAQGVAFHLGGSQNSVEVGSGTDYFTNFTNIVGSSGNDTFFLNDINYTIDGGAGSDLLASGVSDVTFDMADYASFEHIIGYDNDTIVGNGGATLEGNGTGNYLIYQRDGGTDSVTVDLTAQTAVYAGKTDHFSGFNTIIGSGNDDVFYADFDQNVPDIYSNVETNEGTVDFSVSSGGIGVDLSDGSAITSNGGVYHNFASVVGTNGNDTYYFNAASDMLNYFLKGAGGKDTVDLSNPDGNGIVLDVDFSHLSGVSVLDFTASLVTDALYLGSNSGKAGITSALLYGSPSQILVDASGRNIGQDISISFADHVNTASIVGGRGDDHLDVENANVAASVNGGIGDDDITAYLGTPSLYLEGGRGNDTLTLLDSLVNPLHITLGKVGNELGAAGAIQQAHGFENLNYSGNASVYATILGSTAGHIFTDAGNDYLVGGSGNDTLDAGGGSNTVTGGAGADLFVASVPNSTVAITDFSASDRLVLGFDAITGDFTPGSVIGTYSTDSLHHLVTTNLGVTADLGSYDPGSSATFLASSNVLYDLFVTGAGTHNITGGAGADTITLATGIGNTNIYAGAGDDTVVLNAGISSSLNIDGQAGNNVLSLKGSATADISRAANGSWTGLNLFASGFNNITAAALVFASPADGLTLNGLSGTASTLTGSSNGLDTLIGNASSGDQLESASGHSYMQANGDARYVIDSTTSAHSDTIVHTGSATGTVDVTDIASGALLGFSRSGNDLVLSLGGGAGADLSASGSYTGGHVTVSHYFTDAGYLVGVHGDESPVLLWKSLIGPTGADAWSQTLNLEMVGTSGNDLMWSGTNTNYHADFYGGGGYDILVGHGDDTASFKIYGEGTPPNADYTFNGYLFDLNGGTVNQQFVSGDTTYLALSSLDGITQIEATKYNDTIIGGESGTNGENYWVDPYKGDNVIINTGNGHMTVDYSDSPTGISVDLGSSSTIYYSYYVANDPQQHSGNYAASTLANGYGGTDYLVNITSIAGSYQGDTVKTGANGVWFDGYAGNDTLDGSAADYSYDVTMSYQDDTKGVTVFFQDITVTLNGETVTLSTEGHDGVGYDSYGGTDVLINVGQIQGSKYGDTLIGGYGDEVFYGGAGNDTLEGGGHENSTYMDGGLGNDTIIGYSWDTDIAAYNDGERTSGIVANLVTQRVYGQYVNSVAGETDTLQNITQIEGTQFDDTVIAGSGSQVAFHGNGGRDTLILTDTPDFTSSVWDDFEVFDVSQGAGGGSINLGLMSGISLIGNTHGLSIYLGGINAAGTENNTLISGTSGDNYYSIDYAANNAKDFFDYHQSSQKIQLSYNPTFGLYVVDRSTGTDSLLFVDNSAATAVLIGTTHGDTIYGAGGESGHLVYEATSVGGNYLSDVFLDYSEVGGSLTFDFTGSPFSVVRSNGSVVLGVDQFDTPLGILGGSGTNYWKFNDGSLINQKTITGGSGMDVLSYSGSAQLTDSAFSSETGSMEVLKLVGNNGGIDLSAGGTNFDNAGYSTVDLSSMTTLALVDLSGSSHSVTVIGSSNDDSVVLSATSGGSLIASDGNDTVHSGVGLSLDYSNYSHAVSVAFNTVSLVYSVNKNGGGTDLIYASGNVDIYGSSVASGTDILNNSNGDEKLIYHSGGRAATLTDASLDYDSLPGGVGVTANLTAMSATTGEGTFTVQHGAATDTVTWSSTAVPYVTLTGGTGNDRFVVSSPDQLAHLHLDGGAGYDTLALTGSGKLTQTFDGIIENIDYLTYSGSSLDLRGVTFGLVGGNVDHHYLVGGLSGASLTGTTGNDVLGGISNAMGQSVTVKLDGVGGSDTLIGSSTAQDIFYAHAGAADKILNLGNEDLIYLGDLTVSSGNFVIAQSSADLIGNYTDDYSGHYTFHYANSGSSQYIATFDLSSGTNATVYNLDSWFDLTLHLGSSGSQYINTGRAEASIYGIHSGDQVIAQSENGIFEWHNPNGSDSVYIEANDPLDSSYGNDNNTLVLTGNSASHLTFDLSSQMEGLTRLENGLLDSAHSEVSGANAQIYGFHSVDASGLTGGNGIYVHGLNADTADMTVHGTAFGDTIVGGGGNNYLYGGSGGGDTLVGGTHASDNGSTDHNVFVLDGGLNKPIDTILNFNVDRDILCLPGASYGLSGGLTLGSNLIVTQAQQTGALTSANIEALIGSHTSDSNANLILVGDSQNNAEVWVHTGVGQSYQIATIVGVGNLDSETAIASHVSTSATAPS